MARNIRQYPSYVLRLANGIERFSVKAMKSAARGISKHVITDTPYDTGLARSNWLASINVPRSDVRPTIGRGPGAQIAEANSVAAVLRKNDTFYLSGNAKHIDALNKGRSKQRAAGFVERATARGFREGVKGAGSVQDEL